MLCRSAVVKVGKLYKNKKKKSRDAHAKRVPNVNATLTLENFSPPLVPLHRDSFAFTIVHTNVYVRTIIEVSSTNLNLKIGRRFPVISACIEVNEIRLPNDLIMGECTQKFHPPPPSPPYRCLQGRPLANPLINPV